MFAYIEGPFTEKTPSYVVVDCHGVGYLLEISLTTYSEIKDKEAGRLLTHLIVREDAHILYGFFTENEKRLFRNLISISGVGASTARVMLSSLSPDELAYAITTGNLSVLQSIKGIGAKTAQRIVLELKDKLMKDTSKVNFVIPQDNIKRSETLSALMMLGFAKSQSEKVIDKLLKDNPDLTVEGLIKLALKNL